MTSGRVIRLCAGFDLVVTGLFALPFIAKFTLIALFSMSNLVSEPVEIPEFTQLTMLFINLMGTLGVVWALARLAFPTEKFGWLDAWARLWVSILLIYYLTQPGVPVLLGLFIASELIGAWAQFWILRIPEI